MSIFGIFRNNEQKYVVVCSRCGKRSGESKTIYYRDGEKPLPPWETPYVMHGRCPSSADGKHKPRWIKA